MVADRLVSNDVLKLVTCELQVAQKRPGCAEEAQNQIYEWCKSAILAGKSVIRLKIGDPFLFGRLVISIELGLE